MLTVVQSGFYCVLQHTAQSLDSAVSVAMTPYHGQVHREKYGVPPGGAMDSWALSLNHLLLSNSFSEEALEMTGALPVLQFEAPIPIAITGKPILASTNGRILPMNRMNFMEKGSILEMQRLSPGGWTYLGIAGGFMTRYPAQELATVSAIGCADAGKPYQAYSFKTGDQLFFKAEARFLTPQRRVPTFLPDFFSYELLPTQQIRVIPAPEYEEFDTKNKSAFFEREYVITSADRMGYRLEGYGKYRGQGAVLSMKKKRELISSPVSTGTIQIPPKGDPIVLMQDRQTIGGYPRFANVILSDLPVLAQKTVGDRVSFQLISNENALVEWQKTQELLRRAQTIVQNQASGIDYEVVLRTQAKEYFIQIKE